MDTPENLYKKYFDEIYDNINLFDDFDVLGGTRGDVRPSELPCAADSPAVDSRNSDSRVDEIAPVAKGVPRYGYRYDDVFVF